MNNLRLYLLSLLLIVPLLSSAQMSVSGIVTDQKTGELLPGVNILVLGSKNGTSTDFDGKFVLQNVPKDAKIEFSYIGYKTLVLPAQPQMTVKLSENKAELNEVIIVGYGNSKKSDLTGSVNKITPKNFEKGPVTSPQSLLTGKIAGVTVIPASGAPGEGAQINIRGISSLNISNSPLYVVDGVPIGGGVSGSRNNLNFVNPNDIASIVILKDASATAIYGSRAANGVVLITTKKGKKKDFAFNYSLRQSFAMPYKYVDVLNSYQFKKLVYDTGDLATINLLGPVDPNDSNNRIIQHTNWQKQIYQSALTNEHNFSATGDLFAVLPMRLSVGYIDQDGILKTDNFKRTTAALNLNPNLFDNHLKISLNARGMYTENHFANRGAIGSAILFDPTKPVYDNSSPFAGYYAWMDPNTNLQYNLAPTNPVALLNLTNDFSFVKRFVGNAKFDYKLHFFPDVTATLNVGIDQAKSKGHSISSPDMPTSDASWQGVHNTYSNDNTNKVLNTYLTYKKTFGVHNISAMTGYSYQSFDYNSHFYDDYKKQHGAPDFNQIDLSRQVLLSYFGRMNYKLNDKYLVTATLRADASSLLNPNDRWGYFPSVALAWNIHKENFMANSGFDLLKLRIGYGEVGNVNGLAPYKYLTRYQISTSTAAYQFGSDFYNTYRPEPFNKHLRWEVGRTTNIGLDFSLLQTRLSGSVNLYNKETKDLIIWALVDPFTNFGNRVETNVGNMTNKGIELELNGVLIKNKDVKWRLNYNFTYNKNEVTYMPFNQEVGGIEGGVGNTVQIHTQGQIPYSFYVYQQVYDADGKPIEGVYVDRNKDGIINNKDKYYMGSPFADVLMGLSSTFSYKNFDLSVSTRASLGNYMYNNVASSKSIPANLTSRPYLTNIQSDYYNSHFQNFTDTNLLSDYYVQDASFFKIDNISMGYRFPKFYKNMNLRFYANLQNVGTFTKYQGLDPEISGGIDNNFYPRPRTYSFGFNLDF